MQRILLSAIMVMLLTTCGAWAHDIGFHKEESGQAEEQREGFKHMEGEEGIEAHIEELLEHELAPIRAELAEIHEELERPGLTEIVGGIGWIVGILGFIAYLKSRKGK